MTEAFVQSLPLLDSGDVVIAGAGPAGLCAAVAAARQGARVILLERFGAVGGSLTVGHVRTCMGEIAAGTMQEEIGRLLDTGGACIPHDVERAKYVLSQWLEDNGVAYTARHIETDNPTKEELTAWIARSGLPIKRFFNTSGLLYKSLELTDKLPGMSEAEQLDLLATDGMLVKRPLAVGDEFVLVGFREAEWAERFGA